MKETLTKDERIGKEVWMFRFLSKMFKEKKNLMKDQKCQNLPNNKQAVREKNQQRANKSIITLMLKMILKM